VLGTVLVIAPVTFRNWKVSHEFVLLTTGGGEVFFIGNNADADGTYKPPPFVRTGPRYEHADFIARASEITGRKLSPMQSSWFWFHEGMKFIRQRPLAWVRLLFLKPSTSGTTTSCRTTSIPGHAAPVASPGRSQPDPSPGDAPHARDSVGDRWLPVRLHLVSTLGTLAPWASWASS